MPENQKGGAPQGGNVNKNTDKNSAKPTKTGTGKTGTKDGGMKK